MSFPVPTRTTRSGPVCERPGAIISYFASPKSPSSKCPNATTYHQSLESCLVINLLKVSPPPTCHACVRRWQQPLRKLIVRLRTPKGTIRRNSDLWRSRRLICQTRTCRWPNGQRLASQGKYAFVHIYASNGSIIIGRAHARHLSICSLFQGRFVATCYVKPKKGFH